MEVSFYYFNIPIVFKARVRTIGDSSLDIARKSTHFDKNCCSNLIYKKKTFKCESDSQLEGSVELGYQLEPLDQFEVISQSTHFIVFSLNEYLPILEI